MEAGHYPRELVEKATLSKNDRREHKKRKRVRTQLGTDGSEKTVRGVEVLESQRSDREGQLDHAAHMIDTKDQDLERLDKAKQEVQPHYNLVKQRIRQIGVTL